VPLIGEAEPFVDATPDRAQPGPLLQELVALAALLERVGDLRERALERGEGFGEQGLGGARLADADDRPLLEQGSLQESEELPRGVERVRDPLAELGVAALLHDSAAGPRVVEVLERPLDPEAAERQPKAFLGNLGDRVRLVENDKVPREKNSRDIGAGALGAGAPGVDEGEEERVVYDDHLGRAHPGPGPLVEAALAVAGAARA